MSQENKDLVRRWFEALSRHDVDAVADMVTEDFIHNSSTNQGRDGVRAELDYWFSAFPDASLSVADLIADGDRVVARVISSGTHGGAFMGSPATGKRISVQEVDIFRIENGRIAEAWAAVDFFGMLTQLGLLPSEEPVG
ncbi:MAG TPA: ester cyclase [Acidimicrobiia bacterium]|nr:ester cyclase [Acidimicrobiia bacterium]